MLVLKITCLLSSLAPLVSLIVLAFAIDDKRRVHRGTIGLMQIDPVRAKLERNVVRAALRRERWVLIAEGIITWKLVELIPHLEHTFATPDWQFVWQRNMFLAGAQFCLAQNSIRDLLGRWRDINTLKEARRKKVAAKRSVS